jgi:hypothetical protein
MAQTSSSSILRKKKSIPSPYMKTTLPSFQSPKQSRVTPVKASNERSTGLYRQPDLTFLNQCPKFESRYHLLHTQIPAQIDRVLENEQEKLIFLEMLRNQFMQLPNLDLRIYRGLDFDPFIEPKLQYALPKQSPKSLAGLRIVAIDGGLGTRQYLSLEVTVIKAALVIYEFQGNGSPKISTFELTPGEENYQLFTDLRYSSEQKMSQLAGLRRQLAENSLMLHYLWKTTTDPDLIILDGSLMPPPIPFMDEEHPESAEIYCAVLKSYHEIYRICEERRIIVIGSVKDSISGILRDLLNRGFPLYLRTHSELAAFHDIQYRQIFQRFTDAELLYKLLSPGFRTGIFLADLENQMQTRLNRLQNSSANQNITFSNATGSKNPSNLKKIYATYLQITPFDIPLRIEFIQPPESNQILTCCNKILDMVTILCQLRMDCAIPIPQYEAHLRAHLKSQELDLILASLQRDFQTRELQLWAEKRSVVESKQKSILEGKFDGEFDYKAFYSTFISKRHDRFPF